MAGCPVRMPVEMRDHNGGSWDTFWCYQPADPWAVSVQFVQQGVTWTFARHLVAIGLHMPAGLADVQVWPVSRYMTRRVALRLCSPDGEVALTASPRALEEFLKLSYGWVPAGDEPAYLDVDVAVARVLEEADRC